MLGTISMVFTLLIYLIIPITILPILQMEILGHGAIQATLLMRSRARTQALAVGAFNL